MPKPKTLGVLVEKVADDPPTFSAGVVWGVMPFLAGVERGATPGAAVAALEASARRLGYEPTVAVFGTLEDAQAEGRRRLAAEDVLRTLDHALVRLPAVLAGDGEQPDEHDRRVLRELDGALRATRAVAAGGYDEEKRAATPPVRDGRIFCPSCGPDYPGAYFTATADALATARLSPTGDLQTWRDVVVSEENYRELRCGSCGAVLGDLVTEGLEARHPDPRAEGG